MRITLLLSAALLLLFGCATFSTTPTPTPPLLPTGETPNPLPEPTDPSQLIVVSPSQTFDIVLPSNPSTGYHWDLVRELDANLLQLVEQTYIAEQPVIPGSGGMDVWTLSAIATGETTIELGYYPPSGDAQPQETVTFSIRVE
ncbi:MAG TPA: protease inhibitor I42 family protein [Anaerolineales bacterium]|nr:protease inhibitor I42 family protein [Anaerolineales bacterium]